MGLLLPALTRPNAALWFATATVRVGCTVDLWQRPSPVPCTAPRSILPGFGETAGAAICNHPGVDKLAFTVRAPASFFLCWLGGASRAVPARGGPTGRHHGTTRRMRTELRCPLHSHPGLPIIGKPIKQGSTDVGKIVGAAAAKRVVPVSLELGELSQCHC